MKHPTAEDWIPYLFGETGGPARNELKRHLRDCAQCREQLQQWQATRRTLDRWKLPRPAPAQSTWLSPALRWAGVAAVCVLLIGLGFSEGQASSRSKLARAATEWKSELQRDLRADITREFNAELVRTLIQATNTMALNIEQALSTYSAAAEAGRAADLQRVYAAILQLKREVDTVALNTDESFRFTERQLLQLAGLTGTGEEVRKAEQNTLQN